MLQELSHMDRITQLQDEIQQIRLSAFRGLRDETYVCSMPQILTIMSNTVAYLTSRANFVQVSAEVPITKQRNPEKYDAPDVFKGMSIVLSAIRGVLLNLMGATEYLRRRSQQT